MQLEHVVSLGFVLLIAPTVYCVWRWKHGKPLLPSSSNSLTGVGTGTVNGMRVVWRSSTPFLFPLFTWGMILLLFWLMLPEWFFFFVEDQVLFVGFHIALCLVVLLRQRPQTLIKNTAAWLVIALFALGAHERITGTREFSLHNKIKWEYILVPLFGSKILDPPGVHYSPASPRPTHGVQWTRADVDGKPAVICVLKPGEVSEVLPLISKQFRFQSESDFIAISNGVEHLIADGKYRDEDESRRMGFNGLGGNPKIRFKAPTYAVDDTVMTVVFK